MYMYILYIYLKKSAAVRQVDFLFASRGRPSLIFSSFHCKIILSLL